MVQAVLRNLAVMSVTSTGTGTLTLGTAVAPFNTFDLAGCSTVSSGETVFYAINDVTQSEIGTGTYISSALTLSRTPLDSTSSGAAIDVSLSAQVSITPPSDGFKGRLVQLTDFTASGSYSKPSWLSYVHVHCVGAGGGGGYATSSSTGAISAAAGGGGGGSYSFSVILASGLSSTETVTVGGGGTGGDASTTTAASSGGTTSFGSLVVANGGGAGTEDAGSTSPSVNGSGSGGSVGTGDIRIVGGDGNPGFTLSGDNLMAFSGFGGSAPGPYGAQITKGRGNAGGSQTQAGAAGAASGGGGAGAIAIQISSGQDGGAGNDGRCVVWEFA